VDDSKRPAFNRAKRLIAALNEEGKPLVVHGLLQAVLIAEANALDEKHKEEDRDGILIRSFQKLQQ
jgi:hypothetical protein